MDLEHYFKPFKDRVIGENLIHAGQKIVYSDWTASGRLYAPIEDFMTNEIGPIVANTHTEASFTGSAMTKLYHQAQQQIKAHVNASKDDVLICAGQGMTTVVNKFQRILGLRIAEKWRDQISINELDKPVVFVTHMEHHSNQTSWNECAVTLVVLPADANKMPDYAALDKLLIKYAARPLKIGSFSACSNVTGVKIDYTTLAETMHKHGGYCFVDFAASAPYVDIDMHPENPLHQLDAVMFSPHKFLGGPGSSGVLVFNSELYNNTVPDHPGGGTVSWTNPWGGHQFFNDIEVREDGGTPGFLQTIRTAMAIQLKDAMGTENINRREKQLIDLLFDELIDVPGLKILHDDNKDRLCILSFYVTDVHFNLVVRLLSDRFGIQTRGGCSCAGTYGHILLGIDQKTSCAITNMIDEGDLSQKPGWIRVSLHPTTTDNEVRFIAQSIKSIVDNIDEWQKDYVFDPSQGDYIPIIKADPTLNLNAFDPLSNAPENKSFLQKVFS